MAAKDKDTIYIDVDDEITGVIDKLKNSDGKVVALVLPKRATVFQSIVNMKLLKRAADSSKKSTVLITSEAALLPLAGIAGVHVAKTLTSKPAIPLIPTAFDDNEDAISDDGEIIDQEPDPYQTVGELAGGAAGAEAISAAKPPSDEMETVSLDNETPDEPGSDGATAATVASKKKADKKNKKLKVPNFERFRLALILLAVVIVLLILGFIFANSTLPKATITVTTNATKVDTNLNLNLSTTAKTLDQPNATLPAKLATQQKTYTANTVTTGQKNTGNKAQGNVNISAGSCSGIVPSSLPEGSGLSSSNQTYITQDSVSFQPVISHGKCTFQGEDSSGHPDIAIIAQSGGASSNVSGAPFSVSGRTDLTASGSASGGTDQIVQSVNQNDINTAKNKITTSDTTVEQALINSLSQSGFDFAIKSTYSPGSPDVTSSAAVGSIANNVTVTETVTYTIFGVHRADLKSLVDANINSQIDSAKQSILSDGIDTATYTVNGQTATSAQISMSGAAIAGPQLDTASIKKIAAGQKPLDIQSQLKTNPNVTNVTVKLSPFWVSSVPKNNSRITVIIAKPTTTAKASNNASNP